jgi:hypothetical protein
MAENLHSLKRTQHRRVKDLVANAGLDISDSGNFDGGPEKAISNPKYCYQWSFVQPLGAIATARSHDPPVRVFLNAGTMSIGRMAGPNPTGLES